ncbi:unnamed protein product [Dracunculus medinensis]|uniref:Secreted protein n=1 Tax=Dracunculus medinensis TaxID=318479 RepID=A0A0N4U816_DRAME|nr:unnamed protein product [Dracunculus medinensis]
MLRVLIKWVWSTVGAIRITLMEPEIRMVLNMVPTRAMVPEYTVKKSPLSRTSRVSEIKSDEWAAGLFLRIFEL